MDRMAGRTAIRSHMRPDPRSPSRQGKLPPPCSTELPPPPAETIYPQTRGLWRHSRVSFSRTAATTSLEHARIQHVRDMKQVESKYGESISVKDITGRNPVKKRRGKAGGVGGGGHRVAPAGSSTTPLGYREEAATSQQQEEEEAEREGVEAGQNVPSRRKAPTDSSNVAFEEWLRGRRPRDFLAEQVKTNSVQAARVEDDYPAAGRLMMAVLRLSCGDCPPVVFGATVLKSSDYDYFLNGDGLWRLASYCGSSVLGLSCGDCLQVVCE